MRNAPHKCENDSTDGVQSAETPANEDLHQEEVYLYVYAPYTIMLDRTQYDRG